MPCGCECEVFSRIVGYYRPVQQWNKGKRAEFGRRKAYRLNVGAQFIAPRGPINRTPTKAKDAD